MEGWIELVFGPGFRLYSRIFVVSRSFLGACFVWHMAIASGARSACCGCGILRMRR